MRKSEPLRATECACPSTAFAQDSYSVAQNRPICLQLLFLHFKKGKPGQPGRYQSYQGELRMASKKTATNSAKSSPKNAGKSTSESTTRSRSAAGATPSKADLDLRDRLKAGPRRPAGPHLVGDTMTKSAMDALRNEVVPAATEPKKPRARK